MNKRCLVFAGLIFVSQLAQADEKAAVNSVYQPVFHIEGNTYYSGKGFFIELDGNRIFITAHHLFGPHGGYKSDFSWDKISTIQKIEILNISSNETVNVGPGINVEGAQPAFWGDVSADVAVFSAKDGQVNVSVISLIQPKNGETVKLCIPNEKNGKCFAAIITESNPSWIMYKFNESGFELQGTSGAPIFNQNGEVVAINVLGKVAEGEITGIGNPSTAFIPRVKSAIHKK